MHRGVKRYNVFLLINMNILYIGCTVCVMWYDRNRFNNADTSVYSNMKMIFNCVGENENDEAGNQKIKSTY